MKTFLVVLATILFQSLYLRAQTSDEDKKKFMHMAIDLSVEAVNQNSWPFGCVIVKDGVVVGRGYNNSYAVNDITAHGEINAIRDACKNLGTIDLTGCDLYTNGESCPMCFGAAYWAHIKNIYYAASKEDIMSFGIDQDLFSQVCLPNSEKNIKSEIILREEAVKVFQNWKAK